MENKYYTPSIEEFYVGFEFEWFDDDDKDWNKKIIITQSELVNWTAFEDCYKRVKYLDKEDIESLGFKYINTCPIIGCTTYSFSLNSSVELLSGYASDHTECILIRQKTSCFHSNGVPVDKYLFQGYVKNKSELKMLLKMLGIN